MEEERVERSRVEWKGKERNSVEWTGVEWNGIGWNRGALSKVETKRNKGGEGKPMERNAAE
jgi:hypothetical protein